MNFEMKVIMHVTVYRYTHFFKAYTLAISLRVFLYLSVTTHIQMVFSNII